MLSLKKKTITFLITHKLIYIVFHEQKKILTQILTTLKKRKENMLIQNFINCVANISF